MANSRKLSTESGIRTSSTRGGFSAAANSSGWRFTSLRLRHEQTAGVKRPACDSNGRRQPAASARGESGREPAGRWILATSPTPNCDGRRRGRVGPAWRGYKRGSSSRRKNRNLRNRRHSDPAVVPPDRPAQARLWQRFSGLAAASATGVASYRTLNASGSKNHHCRPQDAEQIHAAKRTTSRDPPTDCVARLTPRPRVRSWRPACCWRRDWSA